MEEVENEHVLDSKESEDNHRTDRPLSDIALKMSARRNSNDLQIHEPIIEEETVSKTNVKTVSQNA